MAPLPPLRYCRSCGRSYRSWKEDGICGKGGCVEPIRDTLREIRLERRAASEARYPHLFPPEEQGT